MNQPQTAPYGSWESPITSRIFGVEPADTIEPVEIENPPGVQV